MSLKFYMDENVDRAIATGLRRRGVDALTVQEDGNAGIEDIEVLDRAGVLGRVVFSNDRDMVEEAVRRQRNSEPFSGVIYAEQQLPVGRCIDDLELIAGVYEPEEYVGRLEYLPLK